MERRLAAIFAADVVGFSRLMGEDEAGTLARLKALRTELVQPKIAANHGRTVKLMGDGLLAEFSSVVEAMRQIAELEAFSPDFLPTILRGDMTLYKMPVHNALLVDGLRKAGLSI